jgi:NAD(P)-dependent dehydrogenase (short-subunit alcohol dehydrogenase family)
MMSKGMTGQIAVVTGGANGIGRATVKRLAEEGAQVAVLDHEQATLQELVAELSAPGIRILPVFVNILDRPAVVAAFETVRTQLGPVDILVNNVGQSARQRACEFYESSDELWDFIIDLNLKSTLLCSRQVVPEMRARKRGKIVCVSSDAAYNGTGKIAEYAASKAGIIGFVRSLATELAPFQVNVNAVYAGTTRTRAFHQQRSDLRDEVMSNLPWGRPAEPEEIANVIHFLASDQASYVSGAGIVVTGARSFG